MPVLAGHDGTIIEDAFYEDSLEVNRKLTPLLMDKVMEYDEDEEIPVIITFKETGKLTKMQASVSSIIEDAGGEKGFEFKTIKGMSAKIPRYELYDLANNENIEKIYYDRIFPVPEDKTYGDFEIKMQTSVFSIDADILWSAGYNGTGIIVSVLDTGINYTHADFGGCSNTTFLSGTCTKIPKGYDFYDDDSDPYDENGHGTHVSGTVAADGGIKGVASGATLYAAKVCGSGGCPESTMIAALEWSYDNGADIATLSIGGSTYINDGSDPLPIVIDRLVERGMVITIAAGNEGPGTSTIASPSTAKNCITVGAASDEGTNSTSDDAIADFSCRGPVLFGRLDPDVSAPGVLINSTAIGGGYTTMSGTSMATPHVAGAAALLLEVHPTWTPEDVRSALMRTSRTMGEHVFEEGAGMINITQAAFENASVTVDVDDLDRIEMIIDPEDDATIIINLYNNYATDINFTTFSASDLTDLEEGNTITNGNITLPDPEVVSADSDTWVSLTIDVPSGTKPGIYGGVLNVTYNESSIPLVIPIVVSVPHVGSGTIVATADDDVYAPSSVDKWGDFITYPIKVEYNTSQFNVGLGWTDSGNDLDLYLYGQEGDFGYIVDYSNSVSSTENVSLTSPWFNYPSSGYYWLNVHGYDLSSTSPETFTLTVSELSNISISPRDIDMNVTAGGTNSTNITITNDGTSGTMNLYGKVFEKLANDTDIVEIPGSGYCKMYYLSDYSTTYGLDILDNYTTRLDVYMNWSQSSNEMSLKVFAWMDDGNKVLEAGEFGHPFYGSGEFLFMSDSGDYTNESISEFGIWHYFNDPNVDDILVCARTDSNTTTDNLYIEITTYGYTDWTPLSFNPSNVDLSASESKNVTITVDATNLTTDNYSALVFIDGSPNYAEIGFNVQAVPDTVAPQCNGVLTSPADYSLYSSGVTYEFNSTCTDNVNLSNVIMEFDGANYSYLGAEVSKDGDDFTYTVGDIAAGTYNYKWYVNDTSDIWNNTTSYTYTINKSDSLVNVTVNGVLNNNNTVSYGTNTTTSATAAITSALYRNGSSVSNPDFGIFSAGVYEYKGNVTGNENYSDNSTGTTYYLTVLQALTSTKLYLNGTEDDVVYTAGDIANISALLNTSELVAIETNFTGSTTQLVNGTTTASNLTNTSNLVESTVYNITAYFAGNTNYTGSSVSYNLAVCPVCPEPGNWSDCLSRSQNRTNYYCNVTSDYACQNYTETQTCGSTGGGGGGSSPSIKEYNITENLTKGALALSFGQGSKARFRHNNQEHTATVKTVGNSYIVLKVESDPQESVLYIGQIEKFDLDGDGVDDISVTLSGISSGKAVLIFDIIETVKPLATSPMLPAVQLESEEELMLESELESEIISEEPNEYYITQTAVLLIVGGVIIFFLFKLYKGVKISGRKSRTKRLYETDYGV